MWRVRAVGVLSLVLVSPHVAGWFSHGAAARQERTVAALAGGEYAFAAKQYAGLLERLAREPLLPRTFVDGRLVTVRPSDWTSGFLAGSLWRLYEVTSDAAWRVAAEKYTVMLAEVKRQRTTHDLGFMLNSSYGNGYRLTRNPAYREVLLTGARTLCLRFSPAVGAIKSWDNRRWPYPVIIDNMMNLELLMFAFAETGDTAFRDIAVRHARTTIRDHFRPDGSSCHVVGYDPVTGRVQTRETHQGFSNESAWARGQAWGLYGFAMMARLTKDGEFLARARAIADYLVAHPRMPADKVPYWDFDAPDIPGAPRDTSAAAIMSSALFDLSGQVEPAAASRYRTFAEQQLRSLASPAYRARLGENGHFLLMHAVGNLPGKIEVDVPLIYADYYYLEALARAGAVATPGRSRAKGSGPAGSAGSR